VIVPAAKCSPVELKATERTFPKVSVKVDSIIWAPAKLTSVSV
jgi:hypothetical protein